MKNNSLYYSVGALLYCPANRKTIADSIINEDFGTNFSLALCLEDTINDNYVTEAEHILINSLEKIYRHSESDTSYIPKIFIRVRNPEQIPRLTKDLNSCIKIISGFIIPKFSPENAKNYINAIIYANELSKKALYMMPIYENSSIIDLRNRIEILYSLKDSLSKIEDRVLNIRVGGNDLCHAFGFRRHDNESIHSIKPISNIFSDIVTIYGTDYIISGPVWEYYAGEHWKEGLIEEINEDKLCGFIGKTVIHPNQIDIVNNSYKVSKKDYQDAQAILNWNKHSNAFVSGSNSNERMNEYKTHSNWAQQILYLAEVFGTCD
ncbi:MAG: HpcH/HpaI aldolase/citrate lyase family protein [Lachnospiraceae bacterium]|nr:HpcH/HpaI aldolase/citrate lyase family protein [Lachnospiraceae bacterium]